MTENDRTASSLGRFFRDSRTGRVVVVQWPNAAISVWIVAALVRVSGVADGAAAELRWLGTGALIVWALEELLSGTSPFRRVLGAAVLAWQAATLVRLLA